MPFAVAGAPRVAALRLSKPHSRRVHAVSQPRRSRPIIEHMPQMPFASRALHLGPLHAQRRIRQLNHILLRYRSPEARPPRPRIKLRLRIEQSRVAPQAPEHPRAMLIQIRTRIRHLRIRQPRNPKRIRAELFPPLPIRLHHLLDLLLAQLRPIVAERRDRHLPARPMYLGTRLRTRHHMHPNRQPHRSSRPRHPEKPAESPSSPAHPCSHQNQTRPHLALYLLTFQPAPRMPNLPEDRQVTKKTQPER